MAISKKTTTTEPDPASYLTPIGFGVVDYLEDDTPLSVVPSPVRALNRIILGAIPGEVTLLAGNTSQGKTSLAVQWMVDTAQNVGRAAMLSLEMKKRALAVRLISQITGIDRELILLKTWTKEQQRQAVRAGEYLSTLPLLVDDRSGLTPEKVYDTIVSWPSMDIKLGVVDYVQLIRAGNDSRAVQVSEAVQAVKEGARDADIPIIAISSINRSANQREDKKPRVADLKESGDLEFTADTILMFHYPDDDLHEDVRTVDIHVMKQRNGPTGVASARFIKAATRFEDVGG